MAKEESKAGTGAAAPTREQLLRMLKRDPAGVSRTEIKAAFQDGRLGDQDLDIPMLAGMRRISELLGDLQPAPPQPAPSGRSRRRTPARGDIDTGPPTDTPRPLSEVDHEVAAMAARVESLERLVREREIDIESLRRKLEKTGGAAQRKLWIGVAVAVILALVALLVTLLR